MPVTQDIETLRIILKSCESVPYAQIALLATRAARRYALYFNWKQATISHTIPDFPKILQMGTSGEEKREYIRHAIELVGNFYMRFTDHFPLTPDLANFYFGGSSSNQVITLGGVTPDGVQRVHTLLETCVFFDMGKFESAVLPHLDTVYFDIKLIDDDAHRRYTGTPNGRILENFRTLIEITRGTSVTVLPWTPRLKRCREPFITAGIAL